MRYVFLSSDDRVVQIIVGSLTESQLQRLEADYGVLFGAVRCIRIEDERPVWIGGSYTDGEFTPPPAPPVEPEPQLEPEI